jgi:CheY-like chemotaxis protein
MMEKSEEIVCKKAFDGEEAICTFKENLKKSCCDIKYKLILTDILMKPVDGYNASKKITEIAKETPGIHKFSIIAVTAELSANT